MHWLALVGFFVFLAVGCFLVGYGASWWMASRVS
jgi:hypothetical protein